jgi:hypothetical protein
MAAAVEVLPLPVGRAPSSPQARRAHRLEEAGELHMEQEEELLAWSLLTDKTRIHLRSASVRTYTFFTTGIP